MMTELIEGVGEEVVWVALAFVVVVVLALAWLSTGIPPLEYYVWLVQMQIYPNRRVVQVLHMDHEDASVLENQLVQRSDVAQIVESALRSDGDPAQNDDTLPHPSDGSNVIETPSPTLTNSQPATEPRTLLRGSSTVVRHWEVQLTSSSDGSQETGNGHLLSSSPDQLQQTLRRRTFLDDTGHTEGHSRRLLLSRVPVPLLHEESSSGVVPDLNTIASRTRVAMERRQRIAGMDSEQRSDTTHTETASSNGAPMDTVDIAPRTITSSSEPSTPNVIDTSMNVNLATQTEKGTADEDDSEDSSSIKLKFLDDTQIVASTALEATVGHFKRRYFCESMTAGKVVRLIYRGQLLRDDSRSLSSYGLHDQCILHCHVSSTPYAQPSSHAPAQTHSNTTQSNALGGTLLQSTTAAAIAAIAGTQSVSSSTAAQFVRWVPQTYQGTPIEDNPNDALLLRTRNLLLRCFRSVYNGLLGPDSADEGSSPADGVEVAAQAAEQGWMQIDQQPIIGGRLGQYLHILFAVKFVMLWAFVFFYPQYTDRFSLLLLTFLSLFFATLLFSNRRIGDMHIPLTL